MSMEWMQQANCRGEPASIFYHQGQVPLAKAICDGCPVTEECLNDAAKIGDWESVRGGLTGDERKRWAKRNRIPRHGTGPGYSHDGCRCQVCRDVMADIKAKSRAKAEAC